MAKRQQSKVLVAPALTNGRGTIQITRTFAGVGKIRVASGTKDPKTYANIVDAMEGLFNVGNLATLQALKEGRLKPVDLLHRVRNQGVNVVQGGEDSTPLLASLWKWLETHDVKENTRRGYKSHLLGFAKTCKASDTARDAPVRFAKYRKRCREKDIARSFNQARSALMAWASTEFRKRSAVYQDLRDIAPLAQIRKVHNDAISVLDVIKLTEVMPDIYADMTWSVCFSGMRIGEYFSENGTFWNDARDRIEVIKNTPGHGNKGFSRTVMRPFDISPPTRGKRQFKRELEKARQRQGVSATPNTFRKCFGFWSSESQISQTRIKAYMGHQNTSITDIYQRHEVESFLASDAKRFREYVERYRKPPVSVNPNSAKFFVSE